MDEIVKNNGDLVTYIGHMVIFSLVRKVISKGDNILFLLLNFDILYLIKDVAQNKRKTIKCFNPLKF